jgi:hypothetical protein
LVWNIVALTELFEVTASIGFWIGSLRLNSNFSLQNIIQVLKNILESMEASEASSKWAIRMSRTGKLRDLLSSNIVRIMSEIKEATMD